MCPKRVGAWRINRGSYGKVSLNGLGLGFALRFPEEMHKGNGTLAVFVDQKATPQQREALLQIASGKAGGLPFEVFPALVTNFLDPQFVSFQFKVDGKNSSAKMGNAAGVAFEPIKNPVTGTEEEIRVSHGTGFIFKEAEAVSAKECQSSIKGLSFSWPNKAGFVSNIKYGN